MCKSKYIKYFSQMVSDVDRYHEWSQLEQELLIECVERYGRDWDFIQRKCFPWVTPLKLKNKHYVLTKQQHEKAKHDSMVAVKKRKSVDDENVYQLLREILKIQ